MKTKFIFLGILAFILGVLMLPAKIYAELHNGFEGQIGGIQFDSPKESFFAHTINGRIVDEDGEPLIGVNVLVKGTSRGTATDFDGYFNLGDIEEDAVLIISYVGYQTQEVSINGQSEIEIVLVSDSQMLDEVVVVGYGSQIKKAISGSVQTIGSKEFKDVPVAQMSQKLQGRL